MEHTEPTSWLETIKAKLNLNSIQETFYDSRGRILSLVIYCGVGFLIGFLLKKFGNYVAIGILILVGLALLNQFDLISFHINWARIEELSGMKPMPAFDGNILQFYWEWAKTHIIDVLVFSIGFLMGLRFG